MTAPSFLRSNKASNSSIMSIQPGVDFMQELFGFDNYMRWLDFMQQLDMQNSKQLVTWLLDTTECQLVKGRQQRLKRNQNKPREKEETENQLLASCIQAFREHFNQITSMQLPELGGIQIKTEGEENDEIQIKTEGEENDEIQIKTEGEENDEIQIKTEGEENDEIQIKTEGEENDEIQIKTEGEEDDGKSEEKIVTSVKQHAENSEPSSLDLDEISDGYDVDLKVDSIDRNQQTPQDLPAVNRNRKKEKGKAAKRAGLAGESSVSCSKVCSICDAKFNQPAHLQRHMVIHDRSRSQQCQACGAACGDSGTLRWHQRLHHPEILSYQCPLCQESFEAEEPLLRHRRLIHPKELPCKMSFKCSICQAYFRTMKMLQVHRAIAHSTAQVEPRRSLRRLYSTFADEDGRKKYKCNEFECGKVYSSHAAWYCHRKYAHNRREEDILRCKYCDKSNFRTKQQLETHINAHLGIRPYKCNLCDKAFKQVGHLTAHRQGIHGNTRPHVCTSCNKAFTLRPNYLKHLEIHRRESGEKIPTRERRSIPAYRRLANGQAEPIAVQVVDF